MAFQKAREIYSKTLKNIEEEGLYKKERLICSPQGGKIKVQFPESSPVREIINLCSNNYLGLSSHPEIIQAAHQGLDERGFGMSSVRFICGTQDIHRELEKEMSSFLKLEDTILFASCFDANAAVFECLLTKEDAIFSDQLVHASIIDGIRLSRAERNIFEHSNLTQLEDQLGKSQGRLKLIVTDGVFSMDGDLARLEGLVELAERFDAMLMVDDSHATGFIGENGRGTPEHFGVEGKVDLITTTFGKALGGATGGCVSGRKEIVELLRQRGRPYLFSNALMPAVVKATLEVLKLVRESSDRRKRLDDLRKLWRGQLTEAGFDLKEGETPIVPVMLYDAKLAQAFSQELYQLGVFAIGFFFPVVAKGQARIRTQMSAALTQDDLGQALDAFVTVGKKLSVLK